jgi:nucleoside-diphosphate-sugar epimerase
MRPKTLITGGAGFIATRLARLLGDAGHEVILPTAPRGPVYGGST